MQAGQKLAPYELISRIGVGGMGEVWKARDPRVDRMVAIKLLKASFNERFEREARAIAALNHPNICTLYDVGPDYLVMEYIEGRPVAGPLPINEALRLGIQMAAALAAAHARGILHRDLKPGNILLAKSGTVKLLDFGLAKFVQNEPTAEGMTVTSPLTAQGQIMGTLQYMSPEQLEGKEADARSDIFAFGLVLYELLTGKRAFAASSHASLVAAIMKEEPQPLTSALPQIPQALDRTLHKCLAKDPERRWQTAADLRDELEWIAQSHTTAKPEVFTRRAFVPAIAGAVLAGVGGAGLAAWALRGRGSQTPTARPMRFQLALPEGVSPERVIFEQSLAISPTGGRIAFVASTDRGTSIWLQRLDSVRATPLAGTEGAKVVFWSPDGQFIGFTAAGKMKKIPAEGGTPLPICDITDVWFATWNQDGNILASSRGSSALIAVNSGEIRRWKSNVLWPTWLDGKRLLYVGPDPELRGNRAYVEGFSTGVRTALMPTDTKVVFVPERNGASRGYLVFGRSATLLAQRFDAERLSLTGEPVPLADSVPFFRPTAWSEFAASNDGILIYGTGLQKGQLTWLDRGGRQVGTIGQAREFWGGIRLTQDGRKLAVDVADPAKGGTDIWVYDLSKSTAERLTFEPGVEAAPVWSPDGTKIAFASAQNAPPQLRVNALTARGQTESFPPSPFQMPEEWSSDGRWIFFNSSGDGLSGGIWVASVADRKLMPLLQTESDSRFPSLSTNGKYLAFVTNETGRSEVYVQRFEASDSVRLVGERRRVSQNGGIYPRWRSDDKELFFLSLDREMMAVAAHPGSDIELGSPATLFRMPVSTTRTMAPTSAIYDVSSDGQRFLVIMRDSATAPLQVAVNWPEALKS